MRDEVSNRGGAHLTWIKSSYSSGAGGECVEIARTPGTVHVRDSKQSDGPILAVGQEQWAMFVRLAVGG